jgi:transcriptional regulator with XRE-family HTH domain
VARGFDKGRSATLVERPPFSALQSPRRPASAGKNGNGKIRQGDEIFGRLVAVRRAALGLSQEDLAAGLEMSPANVAEIENGRPPGLETLERLAVALAAESRRGRAWSSLGRRWRVAGLATAVLIPALLILNGRSGENDRGGSSVHLPEAASRPPAVATPVHAPVVRVDAHGKPLRGTPKGAKDQRTKAATSRHEGGGAAGEAPPGSAPKATVAPTSPAKPAPTQPPSGAVSPQPSGSSTPTTPLQPTGKPEGSPGNGPGGGGGSGSGGTGGNGPDGTGPPGQLR